MIEKSCRCGKSKKNFKMDIGPFYIDECCIEAGYDDLGNLKKKAEDQKEIANEEVKVQEQEVAQAEAPKEEKSKRRSKKKVEEDKASEE